ncbi:MAG: SixA phosphatase family protein [Chitinophagales bacterium]|mgnify:CR=1 FL=1
MKTLYVVRHAKSDWANADILNDIDRPLNKRGVQNAYEMAARLKAKSILPDFLISSNGIRALHTAVIFAHQIGFDTQKIVIKPSLYHAPVENIVSEIKNIDSGINKLMIFSHNPGLSDFVSFLNKKAYLTLATCAIFTVALDIKSWEDFSFENAKVLDYDFPKNLK